MSTLSVDDLKSKIIAEVVGRYRDVINGTIDMSEGKAAVGLIISYHKSYEQNDGNYDSRIISIFPRGQRCITLNLIYKTDATSKFNQVSFSLVPQGDEKGGALMAVLNSAQVISDRDNIDQGDIDVAVVQRLPSTSLLRSKLSSPSENTPRVSKTISSKKGEKACELCVNLSGTSDGIIPSEMTMPNFSDQPSVGEGQNSDGVFQQVLSEIIQQ